MTFGSKEWTTEEEDEIAESLNKRLGPEFIAERPGPGGMKIQYLEGWKVIEIANEILGFNGWANEIKSQTVDFIDMKDDKYSVGVSSTVRVTLQNGSFHEDVGYGVTENSKSKGDALDKARKSSVTDAIKRALKHFGSSLGNCLGNKDYLNKIKKMSRPTIPPFDSTNLLRHRDLPTPTAPSAATIIVPANTVVKTNNSANIPINLEKPVIVVPAHAVVKPNNSANLPIIVDKPIVPDQNRPAAIPIKSDNNSTVYTNNPAVKSNTSTAYPNNSAAKSTSSTAYSNNSAAKPINNSPANQSSNSSLKRQSTPVAIAASNLQPNRRRDLSAVSASKPQTFQRSYSAEAQPNSVQPRPINTNAPIRAVTASVINFNQGKPRIPSPANSIPSNQNSASKEEFSEYMDDDYAELNLDYIDKMNEIATLKTARGQLASATRPKPQNEVQRSISAPYIASRMNQPSNPPLEVSYPTVFKTAQNMLDPGERAGTARGRLGVSHTKKRMREDFDIPGFT